MDLSELTKLCAKEDKAIAWVERLRWPHGPVCPRCGVVNDAYRLTTRRGVWKCGTCRNQFTVRVGTIFEDSKLPLSKWLLAIHLMCSSKKGISATQISRELGITGKSAWHLCHRIRHAMTQEPLKSKLGGPESSGVVEVDETYIGGKAGNNKHKGFKAPDKIAALTMVERGGDVRRLVLPNTRKGAMIGAIKRNVSDTAHVMTDARPTPRRTWARGGGIGSPQFDASLLNRFS